MGLSQFHAKCSYIIHLVLGCDIVLKKLLSVIYAVCHFYLSILDTLIIRGIPCNGLDVSMNNQFISLYTGGKPSRYTKFSLSIQYRSDAQDIRIDFCNDMKNCINFLNSRRVCLSSFINGPFLLVCELVSWGIYLDKIYAGKNPILRPIAKCSVVA